MPDYEHITIQPVNSTDPTAPSKELGSLWPQGYYQFVLDRTEHETLCWLADHGYDGNLYDQCAIDANVRVDGTDISDTEEDNATQIANAHHFRYRLPMELAFIYLDSIEEDHDAYLSCNGSRSLAEKLRELEQACQYHNP